MCGVQIFITIAEKKAIHLSFRQQGIDHLICHICSTDNDKRSDSEMVFFLFRLPALNGLNDFHDFACTDKFFFLSFRQTTWRSDTSMIYRTDAVAQAIHHLRKVINKNFSTTSHRIRHGSCTHDP